MSEPENNSSIFRQEALEAISSASQFDETTQITNPYAWTLLLACCLLLIGVLFWGFFGVITLRLSAEGVLLRSAILQKTLYAIVYVPTEDAKNVKANMPVLVTPTHINTKEYGSISATVVSVANFPTSTQEIHSVLKNAALVTYFSKLKLATEIRIKLKPDINTYSGYKWTSSKGPQQKLIPGTLINAKIQIGQKKPIAYIIPALEKLKK